MTTFRLPGSESLAEKRDAASDPRPTVVRVAPEVLEQIREAHTVRTDDGQVVIDDLSGMQREVQAAVMDEAQAMLGVVDVSQTFRDADGVIAVVEPDGSIEDAPDAVQDAAPDPAVCDVCTAAKLAESGVMPSRVDSAELHARCKQPGSCTCGCAYSTGARCANCGRTLPIDLLAEGAGGAECIDRADCAKAMLDRAPAAPTRSSSKRATSTAPHPSRATSAPKQGRPCADGCGETTAGGMYRPGHDSKHVKTLAAAVRAKGITLEAAVGQLPSEALQAKLRKQLEAS